MIFIFDWGYKTDKNFGPLSKDDVSFRMESEMVWLIEKKEWFRAFFIPTIPTGRKYYYQSIGTGEFEEISKDTFLKFKPLAELNALSMDDKITDEEYKKRRKSLNID